MNLNIPVVGVDPGPQYATDVNNCLTLVDQHDHSPGKGVQVTPSGLNINADLTLNDNNLINSRSLRMQVQPALLSLPADLTCFYANGVDAYFNDGNGNQVRLTQSGAVAGTPGSIANLVPPASASYNSGNSTFVFQSDANTPANIDGASYVLRNLAANSFGLTLNPPNSMGADYSITLPTLPATTLPISITNAGNMAAAQITTAQITPAAITTSLIATGNITQALLAPRATGQTVAAGGVATSPSSGVFSTLSSAFVPGVSVTITTTGRPVFIGFIDDGSLSQSFIGSNANEAIGLAFTRDATQLTFMVGQAASNTSLTTGDHPPSAFSHIDIVGAGTYTYTVEISALQGIGSVYVQNAKLIAYEL